MKKQRKSSGDRKHGRNKTACEAYRRSGRREVNKTAKLVRLIREARKLGRGLDPSWLAFLRDKAPIHAEQRAIVAIGEKVW